MTAGWRQKNLHLSTQLSEGHSSTMSDWEQRFCWDYREAEQLKSNQQLQVGSIVKLKRKYSVEGTVVRYGRIVEMNGNTLKLALVGKIPWSRDVNK